MSIKSVLSFVASLLLLLNSSLPLVQVAYADNVASSSAVVETSPSPSPEVSPTPDATQSATLNLNQSSPSVQPSGTSTPSPTSSTSDWQTSGSQATTSDNVILNKTYAAPQNSKVTVKFGKLPEISGKLTIKEISTSTLSGVNALTQTAYDISSDMTNGTFNYTLTLPTSTTNNVEVKTSEDGKNFTTVSGVSPTGDTLTIAGLNHFSIFVVTTDKPPLFGLACISAGSDSPTQCFNKIQDAIDAAPASSTINIKAGHFSETLTITKSLTILGSGTSSTFIDAPGNLPAEGAIVSISGSGVHVDISGLTVDGPGPSTCGSIMSGIFVENGADANIHDLSVSSVRDSSLSGCQNGRAILVGWGHGWGIANTTGSATINKVNISDYQKAGIEVSGSGSSATVTNNTITGIGPTTLIAANGIEITYGASASISGNEVTANNYTPASDFATGILLYQPGVGTVVGANSVSNNEIGLWTNGQSSLGSINLSGISGNTREAVADTTGWTQPTSTLVDKSLTTAVSNSDGSDLITGSDRVYAFNFDAFTIVQNGINAVESAGTVHVAAGTYTENLIINKALTLAGAGDGNTTIYPAVSNPTCNNTGGSTSLCSGASNMILIQASRVTIHDLSLNGDNPSNGSGIDARNGIIVDYNSGVFTKIDIHNTTIENIYLRGIQLASSNANVGVGFTFTIDHNIVTNVPGDPNYSVAIFVKGGSGTITDNNVSFTPDAINSNWSHGITFSDNTVTSSASGIHSDNSGSFSGSTSDSIANNIINTGIGGALGDGTGSYGIWLLAPYLSITVLTNKITGVSNGLAIFGQSTASGNATFSGNIINGSNITNSRGVFITTGLAGSGTSDAQASLVGNQISNNSIGIALHSDLTNTLNLIGTINNIISNNSLGVSLDNGGTYNAAINYSTFTGNATNVNNSSSNTLDATHNSWDTTSTITGPVDFSSALTTTTPLAPTVNLTPTISQVIVNNTTADSTINIPTTVINPSINLSDVLVLGSTNTATLNGNVTINSDTSEGSLSVSLPGGITISGPSSWTGSLNAPIIVNNIKASLPAAPSGLSNQIVSAVEVGFGNTPLTFDKSVKLVLIGQAGKQAGYVRNGVFTPITTACDSPTDQTAENNQLVPSHGECSISSGNDLVIWTAHFTEFVSYNQTAIPQNTQGFFGPPGPPGPGGDSAKSISSTGSTSTSGTSNGQVLGASTRLAQVGSENPTSTSQTGQVEGTATSSATPSSTLAPSSSPESSVTAGGMSKKQVAVALIILVVVAAGGYFIFKPKTNSF